MNWRALALTMTAWLMLEGAAHAAPYTVQPGDTLYSLAKRFATTPAALQATNNLGDSNLRVGQILEIPERVHTVKKGETLYGVARLYAVTVAQVRQLNALDGDAVQIGQTLLIPWNFTGTLSLVSSPVSSPAPTPPSNPLQMPISSPVLPAVLPTTASPALPTTAPVATASAALQLVPDLNALPALPSAAQMATAPERPASSLPNGPQDARAIPALLMPTGAALPSIGNEPDPTRSSNPTLSNPALSNPALSYPDAPTLIHTVQSGDTLFNIAKRYALSIEQLKLENALETDSLALGQRLRIPAALEAMNAPQPSDLGEIASRYLGVTYVYGGSSASGLDCSGFIGIVYRELGVTLPRTSREQFMAGTAVKQADLKAGDLVFFDTLGRGAVSHAGIYLGAGEFIHAASNPGKVIVSKLNERYYAARYLGARRVRAQN